MRKLLVISSNIILAMLLCLSLGIAQAEDKKDNKTFSEAELDQMMAPIALYPDSLLSQILMACTYPADVDEAIKWSKNNPKKEGDAAVKEVQDKSWDPSVMSLVAFPQVLEMMAKQTDWVQNLGDAFLAEPEDVMDTVQKLRKKAKDTGNLKTTEQQKVIVKEEKSETIIIVEPADPKVVYVPVYNSTVVYGTWWWPPYYSPWYYYPPGYAVRRGIGFGIGVGVTYALWGGCRWGRGYGNVNINVNRYNNINVNRNKLDINKKTNNWNHNSKNRKGVPYRDNKSREKYSKQRGGAKQRSDYRGRDAQRNKARSTLDKRAVSPSLGRKQLSGAGGDKARSSVNKANRERSHSSFGNKQTGSRDFNRSNKYQNYSNKSSRTRSNAFSGSGSGYKSRQNTSRGNFSNRSMNRGGHSGGFSRGGGGGGRRR